MNDYQHILCAVDLSDDNIVVASRAAELATRYQAKLTLLHVVEYIPIDLANELVLPQQQEIEELLVVQAESSLVLLAEKNVVGQLQNIVVQGSTKSEILGYAEENQIDLIVLGRHGRHGLSRLLGSVANAVLHHATCDVMAVKVGK
ncbi:MAG: universal stress protein [Ectothiorhodospiraceae bacterium]|nr:universal stress protein [Ectothiorhodospiraceae bacterium]